MDVSKLIEWLKARLSKLTLPGKVISFIGAVLLALALCIFTACGTIGWASASDSGSTHVTITTTPNVSNTADVNINSK